WPRWCASTAAVWRCCPSPSGTGPGSPTRRRCAWSSTVRRSAWSVSAAVGCSSGRPTGCAGRRRSTARTRSRPPVSRRWSTRGSTSTSTAEVRDGRRPSCAGCSRGTASCCACGPATRTTATRPVSCACRCARTGPGSPQQTVSTAGGPRAPSRSSRRGARAVGASAACSTAPPSWRCWTRSCWRAPEPSRAPAPTGVASWHASAPALRRCRRTGAS
ncbi:MAG: hypothetical protein AVDCRST_MAG16-97, partial [uncultured Frankineae bacterium]